MVEYCSICFAFPYENSRQNLNQQVTLLPPPNRPRPILAMQKIITGFRSLTFLIHCLFQRVRVQGVCRVNGMQPEVRNLGTLTIHPGVQFRSFRVRTTIGVAVGADLTLGDRTFLNDGVNIFCAKRIAIGPDTRIADWCVIYDTDFHAVAPGADTLIKPVVIGRNVWLGARAIILAGSHIGDHSVIAAGSVVRGNIPPRSVAGGNPAKVIRTFECADDWVRK